jgi:hypothetical protein
MCSRPLLPKFMAHFFGKQKNRVLASALAKKKKYSHGCPTGPKKRGLGVAWRARSGSLHRIPHWTAILWPKKKVCFFLSGKKNDRTCLRRHHLVGGIRRDSIRPRPKKYGSRVEEKPMGLLALSNGGHSFCGASLFPQKKSLDLMELRKTFTASLTSSSPSRIFHFQRPQAKAWPSRQSCKVKEAQNSSRSSTVAAKKVWLFCRILHLVAADAFFVVLSERGRLFEETIFSPGGQWHQRSRHPVFDHRKPVGASWTGFASINTQPVPDSSVPTVVLLGGRICAFVSGGWRPRLFVHFFELRARFASQHWCGDLFKALKGPARGEEGLHQLRGSRYPQSTGQWVLCTTNSGFSRCLPLSKLAFRLSWHTKANTVLGSSKGGPSLCRKLSHTVHIPSLSTNGYSNAGSSEKSAIFLVGRT